MRGIDQRDIDRGFQVPDLRVLASGRLAYVDVQGRVELANCDWLVRVPTDNPEPDFPEDCYRDVPCGLPVFTMDGTVDRTTCAAGHDHLPLEEELGPYGREWEREQDAISDRWDILAEERKEVRGW